MSNEANPWKKLDTSVKYENDWIRINEDQVITPAGKPGIYGVVHFKNRAIAIIPLDDEYNTWIVGQYRYAPGTYEWEVPEGGCPPDELPVETAKRELQEETGLKADRFELIMEMQLSNSATDEVSYTYIARGLTIMDTKHEETEIIRVRKLPFEQLFQMAMRGEIKDALSVAAILKTKLLIDNGKI
jgi:ADP-ribose pyrophosphatase